MREIQVEKKETQFYSEVLPKWVDRADKAGIEVHFCQAPYTEFTEEGSMIIMENLTKSGYSDAVNKTKGLNMEYVKAVMEELAKFHALGFDLIQEEGIER